MELSKYVKNKDLTITNDDFDMEALQKDMRKGYILKSEVKEPDYTDYVSKTDYSKLQSDYSSLEENYNNTVKTLSDTNDRMSKVMLQSEMIKLGFKDDAFDEVAKIRNSLYADEKDDKIALSNIATRFKATYFEDKKDVYTPAPNEAGMGDSSNKVAIKISRNTSLKDLMIPKK